MSEKIATMDGVHEYQFRCPVELWEREGRLEIHAGPYPEMKEGQQAKIDLVELLGCLRAHRHTVVGERIRQILADQESGLAWLVQE